MTHQDHFPGTDPELVPVGQLLSGDRFVTALTDKNGLVLAGGVLSFRDSVEVEIEGVRKRLSPRILVRPRHYDLHPRVSNP
jgi:hypothetical protein